MNAKKIFLENWSLKLTALFLAFILWLMVHGDPGVERSMTIPLEIRNIPRHMVITNDDRPNFVEVTVRGSLSFGQPNLVCVVDVPPGDEGERQIPINPQNVRMPRATGLEVISVRPTRIRLVLERASSKEVPIIAAREGELQPGFEVYEVQLSPSTATVTGPRSRVERIKAVTTETISLQGRSESFHASVNLNIKDTLIHSSPAEPIDVTIEIGPTRSLQTVSQIPVVPDDNSVTVRPARVMLRVLVPVDFKRLTAADFTATLPVRNIDPSLGPVRVKPVITFTSPLDPAIRIKEVVPAEVIVTRTGRT